MLKSPGRTITAALLFSLTSLAGFAAENKTPEQAQAEQAGPPAAISSNREIEQIDVVGQRTLMSMRHEIIREEDNLYRLFNDLNDGDKYDIFCKTEKDTYSYIAQRACEPVFLSQLKRENARLVVSETRQAFSEDGINWALLQNGLALAESSRELKEQLEGVYEDMNEEILRIALENPDYLAALQKVADLKAEYQAAQDTRFGDN